jgi:hypothetical protein
MGVILDHYPIVVVVTMHEDEETYYAPFIHQSFSCACCFMFCLSKEFIEQKQVKIEHLPRVEIYKENKVVSKHDGPISKMELLLMIFEVLK